MNSSTTVLFLALALLACLPLFAHAGDTDGSSGSGRFREQREKAGGMVAFGWGHCKMVEGLKNCSLELDPADQALFDEMIEVVDEICNRTAEEGSDRTYQEISKELKKFFLDMVHIAKKAHYCRLNDDEGNHYGWVRDVIEVGIQITAETVETILTLDSSGECSYTKGLRKKASEKAAEKGDSTITVRIEILITKILSILKQSDSYTIEQQMALISIEINLCLKDNPDLEEVVEEAEFEECECDGESALDVFEKYERVSKIKKEVSGSSPSDSPFLATLDEVVKDDVTYTFEVRGQVKQLKDEIQLYFSSTTDVELRLGYISLQFHYILKMQPWLARIILSVEVKNCGCDIYDVLATSHFCSVNGACSLVSQGLTPSVSTTEAPTAATDAPPDCSTAARGEVLKKKPDGRYIVIDCIQAAYDTWTPTLKTAYSSTFTKTKNIVWDTATTVEYKISQLCPLWASWMRNNKPTREIQLKIELRDDKVNWGTIREFITCSNATALD